MLDAYKTGLHKPTARLAVALLGVATSFLLRHLLVQNLGLDLPTFITFYPAVMLAAIVAGFWSGLLTATLIALGVDYWIIAPLHHFAIAKSSDAVALALFAAMSMLMCLLADQLRRSYRVIGECETKLAQDQAREQVREAFEYKQVALDAAKLGVWKLDLNSCQITSDGTCHAMFAFAPREHYEFADILARIHPEDRARVENTVKQAIAQANGESCYEEFRVVWPDGSLHWVSSQGQICFDGEGDQRRPARFIGVNREITLQKQEKDSLEEFQQTLQVAMASMKDCMLITDATGHIVHFNDAFVKYYRFNSRAD